MAYRNNGYIPQPPQGGILIFHGSMLKLACHMMALYFETEYDLKRCTIANNIVQGLKETLATDELRHLYIKGKDKRYR